MEAFSAIALITGTVALFFNLYGLINMQFGYLFNRKKKLLFIIQNKGDCFRISLEQLGEKSGYLRCIKCPLHKIACVNHDWISYWFKQQVDVDLKTAKFKTACVMYAKKYNKEDIIEYLI